MKRILFFGSSHKIGLTGQLTDYVCSCVDAGLPPEDILCISGEQEQFPGLFSQLKSEGVHYLSLSGLDEHRQFGRLVKEVSSCVEQFRPAVVHAHTNWQLALAVAAKYLSGKKFKIIYTVHGYRHNYRFRSFIARYAIGTALYLFADRVITPSSFLRDKFRFLKDKTVVIFLGLDKDLFVEYAPPDFASKKRLIFPGEFRAGKNQEMLIRALGDYIKKTGDEDIELYLPGRGERRERCMALARALNLETKVLFPGFVDPDGMRLLYQRCQYAVVPSNVETFGLCITEPFALGRVVLTRHVGVADDLIIDGETGFFFDTEEDLLRVMLYVFSRSDVCQRVSRNVFEKRDLLSWDTIMGQYLQTIDAL